MKLNSFEVLLDEVINLDISDIDKIVCRGGVLPICDEIVNRYAEIDDISLYRLYVENLNENNNYLKDVIEHKKKDEYDDVFSSVNQDGLLVEYANIYEDIINDREINTTDINLVMGLCGSNEDIFNFLYDESSYKLHEILIDRYFKDNYYNFMINLEMMLNFISSINNNLIDIIRLELYKRVFNFKNLDIKEKINLYNSMNKSDINYMEMFYDDYRKCKEYAYSMYNDKVLKVENMTKTELSSLYGVDVYELDGNDFTAFVHQTKIDRSSDDVDAWKDVSSDDEVTVSFSMIDQNHFDMIYGSEYFVVLGFSNLDIARIMHVYHSDSFTSRSRVRGSDRINEILTTENLMKNTKGYNEIFYLENNLSIKYGNGNHTKLIPSYVMCYDYISDLEVNIAKGYNIPIVLLHTNKYENKVDPRIEYSNNVYMENYNKKKK